MVREDFRTVLSADRFDFLLKLSDWFYGGLSSDSHLSWPGLRRRAWYFHCQDPDERRSGMARFVSENLMKAMLALFVFFSEIVHGMGYDDLRHDVVTGWAVFCPVHIDAKAVYDLRYATLFEKKPNSKGHG